MNSSIILIGALCLFGFPILWLIAEFRFGRRIRILLGVLAIISVTGVSAIVGMLQRLNYNAWYGVASKELIDTVVVHLEAGENEAVIRELKELKAKFKPSYEHRAHYDTLVSETVENIQESISEDIKEGHQ